MKKNTIITWLLLVTLTVASALVSNMDGKYMVFIILLFAVLKFIGIAFQFMELKNAHVFWQGSILVFVLLCITSLLIIM